MKRSLTRACTLIAAAALTFPLALAGCSSSSPDPAQPGTTEVDDTDVDAAVPKTPGAKIIGRYNDDWYVWEINVKGKPVTCIVWVGYRKGGPACDFDGATR